VRTPHGIPRDWARLQTCWQLVRETNPHRRRYVARRLSDRASGYYDRPRLHDRRRINGDCRLRAECVVCRYARGDTKAAQHLILKPGQIASDTSLGVDCDGSGSTCGASTGVPPSVQSSSELTGDCGNAATTMNRMYAPLGRLVFVGAWLYSLGALALALVWFVRADASSWELVALTSAAPAVGLPSYALLAIAIWRRNLRLLVVTAILGIVEIFALGTVISVGHPTSHGERIRILDANLMYENTHTAALAKQISHLRPDVVSLEELSPTTKAGLVSALARYPYRVERVDGGAFGMGLYATMPLTHVTILQLGANPLIKASLMTARGPLVIEVVHTNAPRAGVGLELWRTQMEALRGFASALPPAGLMVGDFNATLTNQPLRNVIHAGNLRDAAHLAGGIWLRTWPNGLPVIPPFIDIDHALLGKSVGVQRVGVAANPGSDHKALWIDLDVS
jgi:endonuclease/exonuclease/phosphatase (EEP) superfamily protein YafD